MDERTQFEPQWSLHKSEAAPEQVSISQTDGALRVMVMAIPNGMPRRWRRPPALRLTTGQWLRWQINYRFVDHCTGDWSYRQDTLNLAYGVVTADIFLGSPTRHLDERAHLR